MLLRACVLVIMSAIVMSAPCSGGTIHVPADEPTIQAGLNAAAPGDTVLVAPGTYTGPGNRNLDFAGKAVVLRSSAGAATTIIDCQGAGRGFTFHSGETALTVVEDLTVRNGLATLDYGGGMFLDGTSPTIRNCVFALNRANTGGAVFATGSSAAIDGCAFSGNVADNFGGAVYCESLSSLSVTGSSFSSNSAAMGAGIYATLGSSLDISQCSFTGNAPVNLAGGIYCSGGTLALAESQFQGNTGRRGAGVYCINGASLTVGDCAFSGNTAHERGAGIYCENIGTASVIRSTFSDNRISNGDQTADGGGGVWCDGYSSFSVDSCTFERNLVSGDESAYGGGMALWAGYPYPPSRFTSCVFQGNETEGRGGALFTASVTEIRDSSFRDCSAGGSGGALQARGALVRCTFERNHAGGSGGAVYLDSWSSVSDCRLSDNSAGERGGGMLFGQFEPIAITRTVFERNSAPDGGALWLRTRADALLVECTAIGNSAVTGGALNLAWAPDTARVALIGCTLVGNHASFGSGVHLGASAEIENTIIAFGSGGEAVRCAGDAVAAVVSCSDIFGNEGGDWVGCIEDQLGINGCFAADPLFCNRLGGDYTLAEASACAPANSPGGCGLIGAHPVGCENPIGVGEWWVPAAAPSLRVVPNPVGGDGVIEWSGSGAGMLRLYDAAGRVVASEAAAAAGRLEWRDFAGRRVLPSGVYFLRLEAKRGASARVVVTR